MLNQTQQEFVKQHLIKYGEISRNFCIREKYITRLGAITCNLTKEGMTIKGKNKKTPYGTDYVYYYYPNGQIELL
jgi:hypothetical protein